MLNDGYETTIFCNKIKQVVYKNPKIKIVEAPGRFSKVSLDKVMEYLDNEECNNLMIEAGTKINTTFPPNEDSIKKIKQIINEQTK